MLTATPVLTGSLIRVPLGIWTDKYGGRIVMTLLMAFTVPAIWLMSYATAYWHFLVIGLFVGLAGGSFSVGTPYVARWFPKNRQGFAMGVYGAGNSGAAVNKFVHVWSGFASLSYLFRPYQVVRSRRLNVPAGHNQPPPRQPGAGL